ncbi:hypothetical protein KY362_00815 [Candidatus Woesearchaeota archaeon]|nr:hypothetical protein [Candidatus Woesearchaeota archaeon]
MATRNAEDRPVGYHCMGCDLVYVEEYGAWIPRTEYISGVSGGAVTSRVHDNPLCVFFMRLRSYNEDMDSPPWKEDLPSEPERLESFREELREDLYDFILLREVSCK